MPIKQGREREFTAVLYEGFRLGAPRKLHAGPLYSWKKQDSSRDVAHSGQGHHRKVQRPKKCKAYEVGVLLTLQKHRKN